MRCSLFLFLIVWSAAGFARDDFLLAPESPTVAPGGRIEVTLFLLNDSAEERSFDLPARLTLRPRGRTDSPVVVLEATEPRQAQVRLARGAFHRARYAGTLPAGLVGETVLEPVDFKGPPVAFFVGTPEGSRSGERPQSALRKPRPLRKRLPRVQPSIRTPPGLLPRFRLTSRTISRQVRADRPMRVFRSVSSSASSTRRPGRRFWKRFSSATRSPRSGISVRSPSRSAIRATGRACSSSTTR